MYKLIGINSESETCEKCGKSNLKRVMLLVPVDGDGNVAGDVMHVGMDCGATMLGWSDRKTRKEIELRSDFEKFVAKLQGFAADVKNTRQAIIDWVFSRYAHYVATATQSTLVVFDMTGGVKSEVVVW